AIFKMLAKDGNIEEQMMYNTYNMGIGMVIAVDKADADKAVATLKAAGEEAYILGEAVNGEKGIDIL
ncbi:MAG: AIR synthase-related protein, partial [Lachnospiraceae bacterium]